MPSSLPKSRGSSFEAPPELVDLTAQGAQLAGPTGRSKAEGRPRGHLPRS